MHLPTYNYNYFPANFTDNSNNFPQIFRGIQHAETTQAIHASIQLQIQFVVIWPLQLVHVISVELAALILTIHAS